MTTKKKVCTFRYRGKIFSSPLWIEKSQMHFCLFLPPSWPLSPFSLLSLPPSLSLPSLFLSVFPVYLTISASFRNTSLPLGLAQSFCLTYSLSLSLFREWLSLLSPHPLSPISTFQLLYNGVFSLPFCELVPKYSQPNQLHVSVQITSQEGGPAWLNLSVKVTEES